MRRLGAARPIAHVAVASGFVVTIGCGAVYGADPGAGAPAADDASTEASSAAETGAPEASTLGDDSAPPFDGAVPPVKCASSAPACDAAFLAKANGNPTSMTLLDSSLYWADLTTKTIQAIPTASGMQMSTELVAAAGRPSGLTSAGGRLLWMIDSALMPSSSSNALAACTPAGGTCTATMRSIVGTSQPAVGSDGMISFGTVNSAGFMMPELQIVRIPADLSSTASQTIASNEGAIVATTFSVGDRLVWITGGIFSCDPTNCAATRVAVTTLPGSPVASAVDGTSIAWIDSATGNTIYRCAVGAACIPTKVATSSFPITALLLDGGFVVFATSAAAGTGLYRCPSTGCDASGPELVARGGAESASFVAADATAYFWVDRAPSGPGLTFYRAPR